MNQRLTRRTVLSLFGTSAAGLGLPDAANPVAKSPSGQQLPPGSEFVRFLDEVTETPVVRLTSLSSFSYLPARENRAVSVKGRFLVFSSDRTGPLAPFRVDLRTGQVLPLVPANKLERRSLALDSAGRLLFFLDSGTVKQLNLANRKLQTVVENVSSFSLYSSIQDLTVVRNGKLIKADGREVPVGADVNWCQVRPGGEGCLFARRTREGIDDLYFVSFATVAPAAIRLAEGPFSEPCWSPDGHSALFLREGVICEVLLDSKVERRVGGVSRFVTFSPNADNSVFVGAVRSKAQPTINLLLRNPPREFTLCEHKAGHPENCDPVFSADSRRVYFNSDFQGKPAIYSVNVEALIEETAG